MFVSYFTMILISMLVNQVHWACSLPYPQWGVPAAADAANQIDIERFKSLSAHHNEAENLSHFTAFSEEDEEDGTDSESDDDILTTAFSSKGTLVSRTEAANKINYHRQYPYYNQQYYQSFRQGQGPQQHWGFWKNGLDNMYYFLSSFFSQ